MAKALRLGILIVSTLLLFGVGVFWIGSREFRFTSTYRLSADFRTVAGLGEGAAVRVGRIHQGTVHRILLPPRPDQKVRVEMDLRTATRNVIKRDSVATIRTEGLVGDQYVEISFGSPDAASVRDGDAIAAEAPLQMADMLKKANAILDSAGGAVQNIGDAAGNLQSISSKVNGGRGTMGAFINDRSVYEHVNRAVVNLEEDTEALKHNFFLRGFFKKRGYEDSSELKKHALAELPAGRPENRFSLPGAKVFDKADSAKIKSGKLLDQVGQYLEQNSYGLAVVAGHADQKGDTEKQQELTQARAAVIRGYLAEHFKLDDTRIKTFAGGKSADVPEGGTVEIVVYPRGSSMTKLTPSDEGKGKGHGIR
jgi:phospholipid/cholesterol/gamma-HCH transport system substrate-binding protein